MTDDTPDDSRRPWHDFAHTAALLMAKALAAHERAPADERVSRPAYHFERLAAATMPAPQLPSGSLEAKEGGLSLAIDERGPELWLTLQLEGFAALDEHGGREARLVSGNGAIDYPFHFDRDGRAVCVLANEEAVRTGIANCTVEFFDA